MLFVLQVTFSDFIFLSISLWLWIVFGLSPILVQLPISLISPIVQDSNQNSLFLIFTNPIYTKIRYFNETKTRHITRYSFIHMRKQAYHCLSTVNILIAYHLRIIWNEPYCYLHSLKTNFLPLLYQNIVNLLKSFNTMNNGQK